MIIAFVLLGHMLDSDTAAKLSVHLQKFGAFMEDMQSLLTAMHQNLKECVDILNII